MSSLRLVFITAIFAASLFGKTANLFYLANRQGETEPCGCSLDQKGGLHRLFNAYNQAKGKEASLLVDAGDTFFPLRKMNPARRDVELGKANLIAETYRLLGVDVFTPGERDLAAGEREFEQLLKKSGAQAVSANLFTNKGKAVFPPFVVIKKGEWQFAVVGVSAGDRLGNWKVTEPEKVLPSVLREIAAKKVDSVVLLSQLGLDADRKLAERFPVDVVVGARSSEGLSEPEKVGKSAIVQPLLQGQVLGQFEFGRSAQPTHRLISLGKEFEGPPNAVLKLLLEEKSKIRDLALRESHGQSKRVSKEAFVGHPESCRVCHAKQYEFWEKTKHASAYLVLYAKNQHFDPECITCHSLGFRAPQGFQKIAQPLEWLGKPPVRGELPLVEQLMEDSFKGEERKPLDSREEPEKYARIKARYHESLAKLEATGKMKRVLIGVQCEHCHGNRNGHPGQGTTLKKVNEVSCQACHTPPHAKPYDPANFSKVACPLSSAH